MARRTKQPPGTERARDEQRDETTPRYGGGPWRTADERGEDRFGRARNDDAAASELAGEAEKDDRGSPVSVEPELAAAEATNKIESSGRRAGMGRGESPRRPKVRTKPNPRGAKKGKTAKKPASKRRR
jgi:hypothetical protein